MSEALVEGTFISRINRFVCECEIGGTKVLAHLPNPGRLLELLIEGRKIYAVKRKEKDHLPYRICFVEKGGFKVLVDTARTNEIAERLVEERLIGAFEGYRVVKREVYVGKRRFDFLLQGKGGKILLEVKNSTLFRNFLSMFPDCETTRGRAHIQELIGLTGSEIRGAILFIVNFPKAKYFLPDFHNDYPFAKILFDAKDSVDVRAVSIGFGEDFSLKSVRELEIPWEEMEKRTDDSGIYLLVVEIKEESPLTIGSLGKILFRSGYYVYTGSAMGNLRKRIERHIRRRKRLFWHIDYLTSRFRVLHHFPIRIGKAYECEIAKRLMEIGDWFIPNFGSSDCGCLTHLVGFEKDPVMNEKFIDLLLYFRMGKLEEVLENR
jgi:sugar fermentation stimulation protein A